MDAVATASPPLPAYAMLPATGAFVVLIVVLMARTPSRAGAFVLFALWLRMMLAAYNRISFRESPAGVSWNALFSIAVIVLGLFILRRRDLARPALVPVYVMLVAIAASGIVNGDMAGAVEMGVKYVYFAVILLASIAALEDLGRDRFLSRLLWPFLVPFGLQALSLALGIAKINEQDGTRSFIGGFYHEASFSIALSAGLFVACVRRSAHPFAKLGLMAAFIAGIMLANYRTAVLAMAPLVAATLFGGSVRRFVPGQRPAIAAAMLMLLLGGGLLAAELGRERFADIGTIAERGTSIIKPPEEFTKEDRAVMSGRALIWSQYLYGFDSGTPAQQLVGFGPERGEALFGIYAHNTLISTLFELGGLGVAAMLFLWFRMLAAAFETPAGARLQLAAAHLGFIILNMATMPMWMVEGMMFYGLLCGYTLFRRQEALAGAQAAEERDDWEEPDSPSARRRIPPDRKGRGRPAVRPYLDGPAGSIEPLPDRSPPDRRRRG